MRFEYGAVSGKLPTSLTSLVLAPASFDDASAMYVVFRMLSSVQKLESLTFQMPYGAVWPHLLLPRALTCLRHLVAVDSWLALENLSSLRILHASVLGVTGTRPVLGQIPSTQVSKNSLISLCLERADASTLAELFLCSPVLEKLEIRNLGSVSPQVLFVPYPLTSFIICKALPAADNWRKTCVTMNAFSPHPCPSTSLPAGIQLIWTVKDIM